MGTQFNRTRGTSRVIKIPEKKRICRTGKIMKSYDFIKDLRKAQIFQDLVYIPRLYSFLYIYRY